MPTCSIAIALPSVEMTTPPTTRPRCPQCLRALSNCICALAQPVPPHVQVRILQYPMEVHEAKGTARLLHLCLPGSRMAVGEQFDAEALAHLLHAPWQTGDSPRHAVLLYPETDAASAVPPPPARSTGLPASAIRLVVIDGTWRKSRKMLYNNPPLQQLPRLALDDGAAGRYRIRKAHRPGQYSTMEAATQALCQLAGAAQASAIYEPLDRVFADLLAQLERQRPAHTMVHAGLAAGPSA